MGGPGSGRFNGPVKKDIADISRTMLERMQPLAYRKLKEKVAAGNLEAIVYAINRKEGTPKSVVDVKATHDLGIDSREFLQSMAQARISADAEAESLLLGYTVEATATVLPDVESEPSST